MSFIFPVKNYLTITQGFKASHVGNDYGWRSADSNQPIVAIEDGTVTTAVDGYGNTYPSSRIYGNYVIITHNSGWYSLYGHLLKGICVKKGESVKKGQILGYMGNSGYSAGQHLHFELRKGTNSKAGAVDPLDYLMIDGALPVVSKSTLFPERIKYSQPVKRVGEPVIPDTSKHQIEVVYQAWRMRKRPELIDEVILGLANVGYYDVIDERDMRAEASNGYLWYQVGYEKWLAVKEGYTVDHPAETGDEDAKTIKELKAEIARLENDLTAYETTVENLEARLEQIKEIAAIER